MSARLTPDQPVASRGATARVIRVVLHTIYVVVHIEVVVHINVVIHVRVVGHWCC